MTEKPSGLARFIANTVMVSLGVIAVSAAVAVVVGVYQFITGG